MDSKTSANETGAGRGTLITYITGFLLSILLTLTAYFLVWDHVHSGHEAFSHHFLMAAVIGLAVLQLVVQLVFFLHLSRESKPRWNLLVLTFAAGIVLIVVVGSLWIMDNLNYRMMSSPDEVNKYIQSQGGSDI